MAVAATNQPTQLNEGQLALRETKRGKVYIGELSPEFLRLEIQADSAHIPQNVSQQFQFQQPQVPFTMATSTVLTISIIEAKLNKNYGVTRMDPYCRIQVGQQVYETVTAQNGAKLPYWGKTMSMVVSNDLNSVNIEVFDEHSFTNDDRIAWGQVALSDSLKNGKAEDDWWPLSGRIGEEKEGVIHLKLSWAIEQRPIYYNSPMPMMMSSVMMPGQGYAIPPGVSVGGDVPVMPQPQVQVPAVTEQDLKQMKEMFPNVDEEVIKTVFEASRGNKDAAINSLLSMQC